MWFKLTVLMLCSIFYDYADSSSTYDQRQTGDFNVQVDFKDVQIIALMKGGKEDYVDYDYAYDYSEMTIKPPNGTKIKPSNGTISVLNTTVATTVFIEQTTESVVKNSTLVPSETAYTTLYPVVNIVNNTKLNNFDIPTTASPEQNNKNASVASSISNCRKGFIQNDKGICELKMQSTSNALRKMVKLSQKLKTRRENRKEVDIV